MNIIERFGYDAASKMSMSEIGLKKDMEKLQQDLLEYRRQNNIFKVGDKVVYNSRYMTNEIRIVEECWKGCIGAIYRHATDEEIKAGERL